jgi:alkanesulfonate monooxygenase SsuD/methylene tetrahydromethanopterin reductase-like flavin-dependent oxidoreductase (luciferase family)
MTVRVGMLLGTVARDLGELRRVLALAGDAGVDHVGTVDHVSFGAGAGRDGLIDATAIAMAHPALPVHVAVYLLALRHPVPVARQLSTFAELAPGRLVLGVGIGGEDRHEVAVCGMDPASRGRRMDECLAILRRLLDLAQGYGQWRKDHQALDALLQAERLAPQEVHQQPVVQRLVVELMHRERRTTKPRLRELATRVGVLAA